MKITLDDIAKVVNGNFTGKGSTVILGPAKIEEAGEGEITFLANPKYEQLIYTTKASAVLVDENFQPSRRVDSILLRVPNVYMALSKVLEEFKYNTEEDEKVGISEHSFVARDSTLAEDVTLMEGVVVDPGASIGTCTKVFPGVYIGKNVSIGARCVLYPGVKVMEGTIIGDGCIIHANTVIGCDGFGYVPNKNGAYTKIPQTGIVRIGHHVELGANVSIDRATMGETIIGNGVKIDNLVQIAHNVVVGDHTVIAAQVGIAGSAKVGKHCVIGGQVGIAGHLTIADGTQIQAQSGVSKSTKDNDRLYGTPAINYPDYQRSYILFKNLPELEKRIRRLEQNTTHASKMDK